MIFSSLYGGSIQSIHRFLTAVLEPKELMISRGIWNSKEAIKILYQSGYNVEEVIAAVCPLVEVNFDASAPYHRGYRDCRETDRMDGH